MGKEIDWPTFHWTKDQEAIWKAYRDQEPIEIKGRRCLIVEAYVPKGEDRLCYKVRYLD